MLVYGYEYKQIKSRIIFLVQIPMSSMDAQQRYTHDTKFQEYAAREECNVVLRPYVRRHSVTYSMDIQQQQPEHALEVNYSVHSHNTMYNYCILDYRSIDRLLSSIINPVSICLNRRHINHCIIFSSEFQLCEQNIEKKRKTGR